MNFLVYENYFFQLPHPLFYTFSLSLFACILEKIVLKYFFPHSLSVFLIHKYVVKFFCFNNLMWNYIKLKRVSSIIINTIVLSLTVWALQQILLVHIHISLIAWEIDCFSIEIKLKKNNQMKILLFLFPFFT